MQVASPRSAGRTAIKTVEMPPPLLGINARDPLTSMKPGYALRLENWICRTDGLHIRPGSERWLTYLNGPVQSLFAFTGPGLFPQVFCATPTTVYSATIARASNIDSSYLLDDNGATVLDDSGNPIYAEVASSIFETLLLLDDEGGTILDDSGQPIVVDAIYENQAMSGLQSGFWTAANHTNAGVSVVAIANGVDTPRYYNGSTWNTCAITSAQKNRTLDPTRLNGCIIHHRRIFFFEQGTLNLWYLDQDAVNGPAYIIPIAPVVRNGGQIVAIGSETPEGGRSQQDRLVVVTDQGEMVVYTGSNPATASTWSAAAVYEVSEPIGQRCLLRYGGDLLFASKDGVLPISGITSKPDPERPLTAITDEIRNAYHAAALTGVGSPLWNMVDNEHHKLTLINVPYYGGTVQFVKPADGGWSAFSGLNATCWLSVGDDLFFGREDGSVFRLAGNQDDGQPITAYLVEAFSKFGTTARKVFHRIRPVYDNPARIRPRMGLFVNYQAVPGVIGSPTNSFTPNPTIPLMESNWDWSQVTWGAAPLPWTQDVRGQSNSWRGISGNGASAAVYHVVTANGSVTYWGSTVTYLGSTIAYESGGQI